MPQIGPLRSTSGAHQVHLVELVRRLADSDAGALRGLYEATVDRAYRAALRVTQDPTLAEDAVAATFVQVWRTAERYDPGRSSPGAWVALIARSRALDLVRDQGRRLGAGGGHPIAPVSSDSGPFSGESDGHLAEGAVDVSAEVQWRESSRRVRRAVESLPEAQRSAIECAFFHGLTHTETARRLGAPLGTVKYRIRAALDELRSQLGPLGVEWGFVDPGSTVGHS